MGTDAPMLEQLRQAHTRSPALMPLGETLGFRVERLEAGWAVVAMETSDRHANVLGATHGGVIFALADTAMGLAHLGLLAEGQGGTTVEVKINFLRPVWRTKLRAEAKTVYSGSTLSLLECSVYDGEQRLIARAVATLMRLTEAAGQGRRTVYRGEPPVLSKLDGTTECRRERERLSRS